MNTLHKVVVGLLSLGCVNTITPFKVKMFAPTSNQSQQWSYVIMQDSQSSKLKKFTRDTSFNINPSKDKQIVVTTPQGTQITIPVSKLSAGEAIELTTQDPFYIILDKEDTPSWLSRRFDDLAAKTPRSKPSYTQREERERAREERRLEQEETRRK